MAKKRDDATANEKAFKELRDTLAAVPLEKATGVNFDLGDAIVAGFTLVDRARKDGRAERIAKLAPEFVEKDVVDKLERTCEAAQHIVDSVATEDATAATVMVEPALFKRATEIKNRMIRTVAYMLDDVQSAMDELTDIKRGSGYMDLAQDLTRLANLYVTHAKVLVADSKNYRADDLRDARRDAEEVRRQYRASKVKDADLDGLRLRATAELQRLYNEVRDAVRFAYRHQPSVTDEFEPLRSAIGTTKRPKKPEDGTPAPVDETKPVDGEPAPVK